MALIAKIKDVEFGVGDMVRIHQKISESGKSREAIFEGMVLKIKGRSPTQTFTVRRMGEANIGIEKIFPFDLPTIEKIVVVKRGVEGVRRAKLYYTRSKSPTEIEHIYKKATYRRAIREQKAKKLVKEASKKSVKSSKKKK